MTHNLLASSHPTWVSWTVTHEWGKPKYATPSWKWQLYFEVQINFKQPSGTVLQLLITHSRQLQRMDSKVSIWGNTGITDLLGTHFLTYRCKIYKPLTSLWYSSAVFIFLKNLNIAFKAWIFYFNSLRGWWFATCLCHTNKDIQICSTWIFSSKCYITNLNFRCKTLKCQSMRL